MNVVIYDQGTTSTNYSQKMIEELFKSNGVGVTPQMIPVHTRTQPILIEQFPVDTRILLMGEVPNEMFATSSTNIMHSRGSWVKVAGRDCLTTISPAQVAFGRANKKPLMLWDVGKFLRGPVDIHQEFYLDPPLLGEESLQHQVHRLRELPVMTIDTEYLTSKAEDGPYIIGFGDGSGYVVNVDLSADPGTPMWADRHACVQAILDNPAQVMVWQNAMFDVPILRSGGWVVNALRHEDTMVAFGTCWPGLGEKGLGTISTVYTPYSYFKDERKGLGLGLEHDLNYNAKDVHATGWAWEEMQEDLTDFDARRGYEISMGLFPAMEQAQRHGFRVDREEFERARSHHDHQIEHFMGLIEGAVGKRINVMSSPQVVGLVFDEMRIGGNRKRTSKQATLMDIAASSNDGDEKDVLTWIIRCRQHRKANSSYYHEGIFDPDGRVRTNWNLVGTGSGRLSSGQVWRKMVPNAKHGKAGLAMQTIPGPGNRISNVRSMFVPDEGCVFVGFDLAQAEARVVAVLTENFDLLEAMDTKDIHCLLASQLPFGLSYDELMVMKGEMGGEFKERSLSKTCRHAVNYVATWTTLKAAINKKYLDTGIGVNAAEAKRLYKALMDVEPGLETWWGRVDKVMRAGSGTLTNSFGRVRHFGHEGRIDDNRHRQGVSYEPQSTIGDLTTLILTDLYHRLGSRGIILAHMHDGGLIQVRSEDEEWALDQIREAGQIPFRVKGTELLIPVDVKAGENWGTM